MKDSTSFLLRLVKRFSLAMRGRRFKLFKELAGLLPKPLSILDIGGTVEFWEKSGWVGKEDVLITTINIRPDNKKYTNIDPRVGDARDLSEYADASFDIVFSNSVIEHLSTFKEQEAMAREVARIGRSYWVQTPNYWFPLEPHFLVPGWQWMPERIRILILCSVACSWYGKYSDPEKAKCKAYAVRLLKHNELRNLFPGAKIVPERFLGLAKSWIVLGGRFSGR